RFMAEGVEGLMRDKTRKPGKPPMPPTTVQRVVDLALGPPPGESTHWTGRELAKAAVVSLRSVQRILEDGEYRHSGANAFHRARTQWSPPPTRSLACSDDSNRLVAGGGQR